MTWRTDPDVDSKLVLHVVPSDDVIEHDHDGTKCACGPDIEDFFEKFMVIHHSLDGRERK